MARQTAGWREKSVPVAAILTLGLGLLAMFLGFERFWIVFVIGFAIVVPLLAILLDESEVDRALSQARNSSPERTREDALETLRDRYARGELDDVEFERKVETLLENESIEQVEGRVEREREWAEERERAER